MRHFIFAHGLNAMLMRGATKMEVSSSLQASSKVEVTLLSAHPQSDLKGMSLKQEMLSLCSLTGLSHEGVSVFCVS